MVDLSVVIVSYNVAYFLDQCLKSVILSGKNLNMEIIVVDNNSVDNSLEMLYSQYPEIKVIANPRNVGFSTANNQAIAQSKGRYILLLNPDTVVEPNTLSDVVAFMDNHPDAGALGVKMIDGSGRYLPESKRGLPTPAVAFYKIIGLYKIFPKSKIFGRYHLGYLEDDKIHKVEVLAGAFMLLRREALNKCGLLDEQFFMYGEDIDLSYRIKEAGYSNYYYPHTRIIHYKGESTKKGSLNYVYLFYKAMMLFARKHFSGPNSFLLMIAIQIAVISRAAISILGRCIKQAALPAVDAIIIFTGFWIITESWESVRFGPEHFPPEFLFIVVPTYIVVWLLSVFFLGGYDNPTKPFRVVRGVVIGTVIILVIYALLPSHLRFSRALILLGGSWAVASMLIVRNLALLLKAPNLSYFRGNALRTAIVGGEKESDRIVQLLRKSGNQGFIGLVSPNNFKPETAGYIGSIRQLDELINIYRIDTIIFCAFDMDSQEIIDQMAKLHSFKIKFKIAPPESLYIIGSNSIDTFDEGFAISINPINKAANRRNKRLFDIAFAMFLLISFPLNALVVKNPKGLLKNIIKVLIGKLSWVGQPKFSVAHANTFLKKGVLTPTDSIKEPLNDTETAKNIYNLYAKDYRIENDFNIVVNAFAQLGRTENKH
ncbi:MAG TPA: glycosyl transferase family 2 [Bacteroidales bacterium]|nr:glycosyl transferase family 2 [Bacteroidales bacterium]